MDIATWKKLGQLVVCLMLSASVFSNQTCHPLSISTCALPFPSNFYTQLDSDSATGKVVDLKGGLLSSAVEDKISNLSSSQSFKAATGFSAASPIMIELSQDFDENSLPIDGGQSVLVFNQDSGLVQPIRSKKYHYAENNRFESASHIIEIFPRSRFEFGQTYTAVVTRDLLTMDGQAFPTAPAMQQLLDGSASWQGAESMQEALLQLEQFGIDNDQVVSFVEFTIGDEQENNDPLYELIEKINQQEHPVRHINTTQINIWPYAASITGQVLLTDYRDETGRVNFSDDFEGKPYWADFILMIPMSSKHGKSPIAIYGHGVGVVKETMLLTVGHTNAKNGIATIAIDQPNHGSRSQKDGGDIFDILNPEGFTRLSGMVVQSSLDMSSLLVAVKTSMSDLDVAPSGNAWWHRFWYSGGFDVPDIDTNNIHYQGTSMGGVLGTSFIASAVDLKSAFLQVSGVGISNILAHSMLFETFGFENLIPDNASAGEAALFIQMLQQEFNRGDAINFAHYIKNPVHGRAPRKLVVQYGIGDEVVYNPATEALAEITDLPLIVPSLVDVPQLRTSAEYEDGFGLIQNKPLLPTYGLLDNILGHASFVRPDALTALKMWIEEVIND
jgi:hypothetical protein